MPLEKFNRPTDILNQQDNFSDREVGLTHPDLSSYVRLLDNGDVEVFASEGLGMVFHRAKRTVSIIADSIRFLTKESGGLRWNRLEFNEQAVYYQEPTFTKLEDHQMHNIYKDAEQFFEGN